MLPEFTIGDESRNSKEIPFCLCFSGEDSCSNYKEIDDWTRSVANGDNNACDNLLEPGWYRVTSKAGELMPTSCIHFGGRCGSTNSVWMDGK